MLAKPQLNGLTINPSNPNPINSTNPTDKITITGTGSMSFVVLRRQIPTNSLLYMLLNTTGRVIISKTGEKFEVAKNVIYLPFSDGVIKMISFYFKLKWKQRSGFWINPHVEKNIKYYCPITKNDLDILNYNIVLHNLNFTNNNFTSAKFKAALKTNKNLRLLPKYRRKMWPTITFIRSLADYLGLPAVFESKPKSFTFAEDYRATCKNLRTYDHDYKLQKTTHQFLKSVNLKLNQLRDLSLELNEKLYYVDILRLNTMSDVELEEFAYPIISNLYFYFKNLRHLIRLSRNENFNLLKSDLKTIIWKKVLSVKTYDFFYVKTIEQFFRQLQINRKEKYIHCHIYNYYDEKECNCHEFYSLTYNRSSIIQLLTSTYNGCYCHDDKIDIEDDFEPYRDREYDIETNIDLDHDMYCGDFEPDNYAYY